MNETPIYQLIPRVMKSIGAVGKDRKNDQQGYKFRGIEDIYNAAHPALTEHGVFCVPQVLEVHSQDRVTTNREGRQVSSIRVTMKVSHKFHGPAGDYVDVITVGEGIDSSDKASNKAMSAAMKYAFVELLSLPFAEVDDSDKTGPDAGVRRGEVKPVDVTVEPTPIPKPKKAEDMNMNATISLEEQKTLHMRFRDSLPEADRPDADKILHDWLGRNGFTDESGNPTTKVIKRSEFQAVGKRAVTYAKEMPQ